MGKGIVVITDDNFEAEVIQSSKPFLLDCWAEWCGPCRNLVPILERVAEKYQDGITVGKLDIDANQAVPKRYSVRAIPTLLLFSGGELIETKVGLSSEGQLAETLAAHQILATEKQSSA